MMATSDLQPDWVWIAMRSHADNKVLFDSVRGVTKRLLSNQGAAEVTVSDMVTSFNSDGFSLGTNSNVTGNGKTFVGWQWKAGTSFSNSAGANGADLASDGSYNRDAGFSIVTFTGNATDDQQIYHGLNAVPKMMILLKNRTNGNNESWKVYHQAIGNTHALTLDTTAASGANVEFWSDETPTSTVFTVGRQDATNGSGNTHVVYCFAEKQGYSKFSSYVGNGSDTPNGVFTWLGFTPAFILIKATDSNSWVIVDNKRPADSNPVDSSLAADSTATETTGDSNTTFDFLSNGFRTNGNSGNNNSFRSKIYLYGFR